MRLHARALGLGAAVLAAGMCLLIAAGNGSRADDKKDENPRDEPKVKAIREILLKMADAMEKNDTAEIKKHSDALKAYELLDIMKQMKLRKFGGIGMGEKEGVYNPDGIDAYMLNLMKNRPPLSEPTLAKHSADLTKASYIVAAIAEITKDRKAPKVKDPKVNPADWPKYREQMATFSRELAEASKKKDLAKVKEVSVKLYGSCTSCHSDFREDVP